MEKKLSNKLAIAGATVLTLAGVAVAAPALAAGNTGSTDSGSTTSTAAPTFGKGHGGKGHGPKGTMTSQTVTVNVPTDGTYMLVVTEAAPTLPTGVTPPTDANGNPLPAPKPRSHAITLTGTGTQTVTIPGLHTGKFTLQLVKLSGTAVNGEVGTDGKLIAPITVG